VALSADLSIVLAVGPKSFFKLIELFDIVLFSSFSHDVVLYEFLLSVD